MEALALLDLAAFMATLALSIYLFLRRPESSTREVFSIFLFVAALSTLMMFYAFYSTGMLRIIFLKAEFALALFAIFVLLHFAFLLADQRFYLAYYIFPLSMVVIALFTDLFVSAANMAPGGFGGRLIALAELYMATVAASAFYVLFKVYSKVRAKPAREKLRWVLLGIGILLAGVVGSVACRALRLSFLSPYLYSMLLMSIFVAYPFARRRRDGR